MSFLEENTTKIYEEFQKYEKDPENNEKSVGIVVSLCEERAIYLMDQISKNDTGQISGLIFSHLGKYYSDILISAIKLKESDEKNYGTYRYILSKIDELVSVDPNIAFMKYSLTTFPSIKNAFTINERISFFIDCIRFSIKNEKRLEGFSELLNLFLENLKARKNTDDN